MAEVLNLPVETSDRRRSSDRKDTTTNSKPSDDVTADSPPPPPPPRRRERDSRERRDDRDFDRPPRYMDRNNRDYKRRHSPSPPPYHRDRRPYNDNGHNSPPQHPRRGSPPYPPFKRRRDDFDGRRGNRGGYGGGNRRLYFFVSVFRYRYVFDVDAVVLCNALPLGLTCLLLLWTFYWGNWYSHILIVGQILCFFASFDIAAIGRFGYDHPGGYDREMGGRQGYGDDRPHGRFRHGGYPDGPSDWDAGRGGFGDSGNAGNMQREGLMSYKQFIQELEDDVLPSEAERRYQEYKSEYISTQKRTYFEAHKDEEWLRNKYHPTNLLTVIDRRNELARKVAKDFLLDLHSGSLDLGPGANANKSGQTSEPNSDDETDGKRRRHGRFPAKNADLSAAPKAPTICSEPKRIQIDIELAQALVTKLDTEKGIEDNILSKDDTDKMNRERSHSGSIGPVIIIRGLTSVKGLEGTELLDTLLTYLWRVHGVDYYGMIETTEPKGLRHVRGEGKNSDVSSQALEWEKKLDSRWQDRMRSLDPLESMTAKEKIDAAAAEALDPFVRKIRDEKYGWKYGCGAKGCTKLFHASEFVQKHLKLKHPELVMELTSKVREDIYFQNYMSDIDAPGGQPVMQQFVPKDKQQPRRRPGVDNRMKDDRGNRRDRDRNNGERFDRPENHQPDFPSSENDGQDKGNSDEPIFDNFAGQGVPIATFATDMGPPPLLMPVPGAGPLGPFVPAPPDVAMRMMREQGGPTPFEQPGRNGRAGPPIILPPSFRQDPRRLRSYQDLDAPDDEVTVIDYRSFIKVKGQQTPIMSPAAAPGPGTTGIPDCMTLVYNMSDCLTYVEKGSTAMKPDKPCCPELAGMLDANPLCLCQLFGNTSAMLPLELDINRALKLPKVCRLTTPPLSMCSLVLGIPIGAPMGAPVGAPSSSEGPSLSSSGRGMSPMAGGPSSGEVKNGAPNANYFNLVYLVAGLAFALSSLSH
ncbi:hypothetical protein KSS87_022624 [Heliosperma pusillum]|nr:hypothetical protein KSS87_022624 [Heliosperma pusillum]